MHGSHPVDLIVKVVPVLPSNCKAPYSDGRYIRRMHITSQLKELVKNVNSGNDRKINSTITSIISKSPANSTESSDQATALDQLQGKGALLRGNALGKPGNQHMRSVSGPESVIRFGEMRFPRENCMLVTKCMLVTERNRAVANRLCQHNMLTHYVKPNTTVRIRVHQGYSPQVGDTVHRILLNKDVMLLNRQPTLHKGSVQAVEVVMGTQLTISTQLTIGLHMAYTTPMNADFDRDENNCYNLHSIESEADARLLQAPNHNFISVSSQAPMYGLVINEVTAAYLMSRNNSPISPERMQKLVGLLDCEGELRWERIQKKMRAMRLNPMTTRGALSMMYPEGMYYSRKGV